MRPDLFKLLDREREEDIKQYEINKTLDGMSKKDRAKSGLEYGELHNPNRFRNIENPEFDTKYATFNDIPQEYWQAAVEGNWNLFNLPDNMAVKAAEQQSENDYALMKKARDKGFSKSFREGFTGMLNSWNVFGGLDSYYANNENNVSIEDLMNGEGTTIYQDPRKPRMKQKAYWAQQWQSMGLSAGIGAEMIAETLATLGTGLIAGGIAKAANAPKLARLIYNMTRAAKNTKKVDDVINEARMAKTGAEALEKINQGSGVIQTAYNMDKVKNLFRNGIVGTTQGMKNAYLNMGYTENEVYTRLINEGYSEKEARDIARESGRAAYYTELFPSILLNSIQFNAIRNSLNGVGIQRFGKTLMERDGLSAAIDNAVKNKTAAKWLNVGKDLLVNSLSEGIEEVWEEYSSIHGQQLAARDNSYNKIYSEPAHDFERYLDNFIGGVFGGALFGGAGKAISIGYDLVTGKAKNEKEEQKKIEKLKEQLQPLFENHINRKVERESKRMQILNQYEADISHIVDENGDVLEGKEDEYNKLTEKKNKDIEEIKKQENDETNSLLDLFEAAVVINNWAGGDSKTDYISDSYTKFAQIADASSSLLEAYSNATDKTAFINSLNADVKAYTENEALKDTESYNENLTLNNDFKIVAAYRTLKELDKQNEKNEDYAKTRLFEEDGSINENNMKLYGEQNLENLKIWGEMAIDFSNYYLGTKMDINLALTYTKFRELDRMYRQKVKDLNESALKGFREVISQLTENGYFEGQQNQNIKEAVARIVAYLVNSFPEDNEILQGDDYSELRDIYTAFLTQMGVDTKNVGSLGQFDLLKAMNAFNDNIKDLFLSFEEQKNLFKILRLNSFEQFKSELDAIQNEERGGKTRKQALEEIKNNEEKQAEINAEINDEKTSDDRKIELSNELKELEKQHKAIQKMWKFKNLTETQNKDLHNFFISQRNNELKSWKIDTDNAVFKMIFNMVLDNVNTNEERRSQKQAWDNINNVSEFLFAVKEYNQRAEGYRAAAARILTTDGIDAYAIQSQVNDLDRQLADPYSKRQMNNNIKKLKKLRKRLESLGPEKIDFYADDKFLNETRLNEIYRFNKKETINKKGEKEIYGENEYGDTAQTERDSFKIYSAIQRKIENLIKLYENKIVEEETRKAKSKEETSGNKGASGEEEIVEEGSASTISQQYSEIKEKAKEAGAACNGLSSNVDTNNSETIKVEDSEDTESFPGQKNNITRTVKVNREKLRQAIKDMPVDEIGDIDLEIYWAIYNTCHFDPKGVEALNKGVTDFENYFNEKFESDVHDIQKYLDVVKDFDNIFPFESITDNYEESVKIFWTDLSNESSFFKRMGAKLLDLKFDKPDGTTAKMFALYNTRVVAVNTMAVNGSVNEEEFDKRTGLPTNFKEFTGDNKEMQARVRRDMKLMRHTNISLFQGFSLVNGTISEEDRNAKSLIKTARKKNISLRIANVKKTNSKVDVFIEIVNNDNEINGEKETHYLQVKQNSKVVFKIIDKPENLQFVEDESSRKALNDSIDKKEKSINDTFEQSLKSDFSKNGKPLFGQDTFDAIHTKGLSNVYVKGIKKGRGKNAKVSKEEFKERLSITFGVNDYNPLLEYCRSKWGNDLTKEQCAERCSQLDLEEQLEMLSHSYTLVYTKSKDGKEIPIGVLNSVDYFKTFSEDNRTYTIPHYKLEQTYKGVDMLYYSERDQKDEVADQKKIQDDLRSIISGSYDGDFNLDVVGDIDVPKNDLNYGDNRKLTSDEKESIRQGNLIFTFYPNARKNKTENGKKKGLQIKKANQKGAFGAQFIDATTLSPFCLYMEKGGIKFRLLLPGRDYKEEIIDENGNVKTVIHSINKNTSANDSNLNNSEGGQKLYQDIVTKLQIFSLLHLIKIIQSNPNMDITSQENMGRLRTFFEANKQFYGITDINAAIDNFLKLCDRYKGNAANFDEEFLYKTSPDGYRVGGLRLRNSYGEEYTEDGLTQGSLFSFVSRDENKQNGVTEIGIGNNWKQRFSFAIPTNINTLPDLSYMMQNMQELVKNAENCTIDYSLFQDYTGDTILGKLKGDLACVNESDGSVNVDNLAESQQDFLEFFLENAEVNIYELEYTDINTGNKENTIYKQSNVNLSIPKAKGKENSTSKENADVTQDLQSQENISEEKSSEETSENNEEISEKSIIEGLEEDALDTFIDTGNNVRTVFDLSDMDKINLRKSIIADIFNTNPEYIEKLSRGEISKEEFISFCISKFRNIGKEDGLFYNRLKDLDKLIEKYKGKNEALYNFYSTQKDILMSLADDNIIQEYFSDVNISDNNYNVGFMTKYIDDLVSLRESNDTSDERSDDENDNDNEDEVKTDNKKVTTQLFQSESYKVSSQLDMSSYLKLRFSTIKKDNTMASRYESGSSISAIPEYEDVYTVLSVLRSFMEKSSDFEDFMSKIKDAIKYHHRDESILKQLVDIFESETSPFPQQYKNELCTKMLRSLHNMMEIYNVNQTTEVRNIYNHNLTVGILLRCFDHVIANPNYVVLKNSQLVFDADKINNILSKITQINNGTMSREKIIDLFAEITGHRIGENSYDDILMKDFFTNFYKFFKENKIDFTKSPKNILVDNYGIKKDLSRFVNNNSAMYNIIHRDIEMNPLPIDSQMVVSGKNILPTYERTLKNKLFLEINGDISANHKDRTRGMAYTRLMQMNTDAEGHYSSFQSVVIEKNPNHNGELDCGIVSISAIHDEERSEELTKQSEDDNESAEILFNQQIVDLQSVNTETKFGYKRFDGSVRSHSFVTRSGYETCPTVSDKSKVSWVKLPKLVLQFRGDSNNAYISVDPVYDYMTDVIFDQTLQRTIREYKNGIFQNESFLNHIVPKINACTINGTCLLLILERIQNLYKCGKTKEAEELVTLLQDNYEDIRKQARAYIVEYVQDEVSRRIGNIDVSKDINVLDIQRFFVKSKEGEFIDASWFTSNIVHYNDKSSGGHFILNGFNRGKGRNGEKSRLPYRDEIVFGQWNKIQTDKSVIKDNGDYTDTVTITYAAIDRVVNNLLANVFMQDNFYGPLNNYGEEYNDSEIAEIISNSNITDEQRQNELENFFLSIAVERKKSCGRMLNKRMAGIEAGGRIPNYKWDDEIIQWQNDLGYGEWNYDTILYIACKETIRTSTNYKYKFILEYGKDRLDKPVDNNYESAAYYIEQLNSEDSTIVDSAKKILTKYFPEIKDFLKMSSSDGQEFITWKEALDDQFGQGNISDKQYRQLYEIYSKMSENDEYIPTKEEQEIIDSVPLNAEKPVYDGIIYNKDKGDNAISVQNLYVKSSAVPLLPQHTKGCELDVLRKEMEKLQMQERTNVRFAFNSAIKVGNKEKDPNNIRLEDITSGKVSLAPEEDFETFQKSNLIYAERKFFSIQQVTNNHFHEALRSADMDARKQLGRIIKDYCSKADKSDLAKLVRYFYENDALTYDEIKRIVFESYLSSSANIINGKGNLDINAVRGIQEDVNNFMAQWFPSIQQVLLSDADIESFASKSDNMSLDAFIDSLSFNMMKVLNDTKSLVRRDEIIGKLMDLLCDPVTTSIIDATQMQHIKMSCGFNKITDKIFSVPADIASEYGIELDENGKCSGVELAKLDFNFTSEKVNRAKENLCKKLGIGDWDQIDVNDIKFLKKLQQIIIDELKERGFSDNYIKQFEIVNIGDEKSDFKMPLLFNVSSSKIESLLISIINRNLCKSYLPGNAYYTATSEGFKRDTKLKVKRNYTAEQLRLKGVIFLNKEVAQRGVTDARVDDDGNLKYAECAISSHFTYFDSNEMKNKVLNFYETREEAVEIDGKTLTATYFKYLVDENGKNVEVIFNSDGTINIDESAKNAPNGLFINEKMIDSEALQMMTLRIPTSGHMSGVMMKIVAILPESMGEMIIVPPEHTVQLGEDFDIDKRFCYFKHYAIDNEGRIRVIDRKFVDEYEKSIKSDIGLIHSIQGKIDKTIEKLKDDSSDLNSTRNEIITFLKGFKTSNVFVRKVLDDLISGISQSDDLMKTLEKVSKFEERLLSTQTGFEMNLKRARLERYKQHLIENDEIDIYFSIFGCSDNRVQKEINKVLGTQQYQDTKDFIIDKQGKKKLPLSPFSPTYQQSLRKENADAKIGVGTTSMQVVKACLIQQQNIKIRNFNMKLLGLESNGDISGSNTLRKKENAVVISKNAINAANQNINLDTVKLDIISFINQNKVTYNFYDMMCLLGYGSIQESGIEGMDGLSIAALIATQPILRDYVKIQQASGSMYKYYESKISIVSKLLEKYGLSKEDIEKLKTGEIHEFRENGDVVYFKLIGSNLMKVTSDGKETMEYSITAQQLVNGISGENVSNIAQLEALCLFMKMSEYGQKLSGFQKILNSSAAGIGKNYSEIKERIASLNTLGESEKTFENITSLIGRFQSKRDFSPSDGMFNIKGCDYYIEPTTNSGLRLLNALEAGQNLIGRSFGYDNTAVVYLFNKVSEMCDNMGLSMYDREYVFKRMWNDFTQYSYLLCNFPYNGFADLFDGKTVAEIKKDLMQGYDIINNAEFQDNRAVRMNQFPKDGIISDLPVSFAYVVDFLKDNVRDSRLDGNIFWNMIYADNNIIKQLRNENTADESVIMAALSKMLNDDAPLTVDGENNEKVPVTVTLSQDSGPIVVSPKALAMMFIQYAIVSDNVLGYLNFSRLMSDKVMTEYNVYDRMRLINETMLSVTDMEKGHNVIFEYGDENGNYVKYTVQDLVNSFLRQFKLRYYNKLVPKMPETLLNSMSGTSLAKVDKDEQTITIACPESMDVISWQKKIASEFGLSEWGMPEYITRFYRKIDKSELYELDKDASDEANNVYVYRLSTKNMKLSYGQNDYNPYEQRERSVSTERKGRMIMRNKFTGERAKEFLMDSMEGHPLRDMFGYLIDYLEMGGSHVEVRYGYKENGKDKNLMRYDGPTNTYIIYLSTNKDDKEFKFKQTIAVEELTHALLWKYIRENYNVTKNSITPKNNVETPARIKHLYELYIKFREWHSTAGDINVDDAYRGQVDHIAGNFEEFLAAFMTLDKNFITVLNAFVRDTGTENIAYLKDNASMDDIDKKVEGLIATIAQYLKKIFSEIKNAIDKAKEVVKGQESEQLVMKAITDISSIMIDNYKEKLSMKSAGELYNSGTDFNIIEILKQHNKQNLERNDERKVIMKIGHNFLNFKDENDKIVKYHYFKSYPTWEGFSHTSPTQMVNDDNKTVYGENTTSALVKGDCIDFISRVIAKELNSGQKFRGANAYKEEFIKHILDLGRKLYGENIDLSKDKEVWESIISQIDNDFIKGIYDKLNKFKRQTGVTFLSDDIIMIPENLRETQKNKPVVGSFDIIAVDKNNNMYIIDTKSGKNGVNATSIDKYSQQVGWYKLMIYEILKDHISSDEKTQNLFRSTFSEKTKMLILSVPSVLKDSAINDVTGRPIETRLIDLSRKDASLNKFFEWDEKGGKKNKIVLQQASSEQQSTLLSKIYC